MTISAVHPDVYSQNLKSLLMKNDFPFPRRNFFEHINHAYIDETKEESWLGKGNSLILEVNNFCGSFGFSLLMSTKVL